MDYNVRPTLIWGVEAQVHPELSLDRLVVVSMVVVGSVRCGWSHDGDLMTSYLSITNRSATRTLFVRPYLAHFCPVFSRFFAVFSVLKPGFQKVAPEDRGPVP